MEEIQSARKNKWLYLFIGLAVLINFSGIFITIIGPDSALYASIAKTMASKNNFIELFVEGKDWLDKPHFPFWIAAFSFKVFGIHTWAYKLPAIIFVLMGAAYTYKFAKALYNEQVALWSVLILLTAQHIIISNNDVRAEPYLTGLIIAAVYHFYKAQKKAWFMHLLLGCLFAACAVMTKGIFALIPIGAAIAGELMIKKQWKMLFNIRWITAVIFVFIFILPELWCLYHQFDAHPEKVVFGHTGVSGLKFFFWDSQFGRFFNTGPIKKTNGDLLFFVHTTLWAFLPWSVLLYISVVQFVRKNLKKVSEAEWYCICGAGLTFLVFSVSKFQLPHYITIIFPFFAILTAQYISNLKLEKTVKAIRIVQIVVISIMVIVIAILHYFFQPDHVSAIAIVISGCIVILFICISLTSTNGRFKVFYQSCAIVFFVNIYFNLIYYPQLLKFQSDSEAAFWINQHNVKHLPVVKVSNGYFYAIDFYTHQEVYTFRLGTSDFLPQKPYLLFAETGFINQLEAEGLKTTHLKLFNSYPVTRITGKFLNHTTREAALKTSQIVLVK